MPQAELVIPENITNRGGEYCRPAAWKISFQRSSVSPSTAATNWPVSSGGALRFSPVVLRSYCCWPPVRISAPPMRMRGSIPNTQPISPRIRTVPIPKPPAPPGMPNPPPPRRSSTFSLRRKSSQRMARPPESRRTNVRRGFRFRPKRLGNRLSGKEPAAPRRYRRDQHTVLQRSVSAHRVEAFDAGGEHVVARARPPVGGGEDLDLLGAAIAGRLDPATDAAEIDDAVAHHAAVEQEVACRHQPVADVIGEDSVARPRDLPFEIRVPPDVIGVDRHADAVAQRVAEVESVRQRVHAGAVGRVHRMQRLDR